ncbi:type II toxin-antitoxin system YafQ family toxin [Enterococcus cecorum]|uniref:type II toxin-antitoxin system YafQ family toxin n=1 Tax=Enterococcus cecorum TaxID=44008 RepID=UPI0030C728CD
MTKVKVAVECIISKDTYKLKTFYKDHSLKGNWQGYRELHIEDDWLLIYKIEKESITLVLTRTGKHDDLFD